ncbi:MAG: polysaccharide deacetylase family protein [Spiribacter salinus]|uniref:Polysaccharide deacetylase family protein n=1 Tax=Spiribacter salinus TaxID=1335746 RepID=A0A540VSA6_9GAMM|nr:MAG: polysaccharide deacetylase family protein [Spiribacter salinus]
MADRLSILIYHRVLPEPDPLQPGLPDAQQFARHMRALARWFNVLPLEQAVTKLREGTLPPRAAAITFDDGYADNCDIALPILNRLGLTATFFIATGFLDGGRMWNDSVVEAIRQWPHQTLDRPALGLHRLPLVSVHDKRSAIQAVISSIKHECPDERLQVADSLAEESGLGAGSTLMMTSDWVAKLYAAGMGVGAHTHTHPILRSLALEAARADIEKNRETLEEIIQAPVRLFAYPNGKPAEDYTYEHARLVRSMGFTAAVSTAWGTAEKADDPYQLPRFTPWDAPTWRWLLRLGGMRWSSRRSQALNGDQVAEAP